MAFSIVGNELRHEKPKGHNTLETCSSHTVAIGSAKDRAKSVATTTVAVQPTAFAEVALDFGDARAYTLPVDVAAVRARLLRAAAVEGLDDAEIIRISALTDAEITKGHQQTIRAKQMVEVFRHGGSLFAADSWIVRTEDGTVNAYDETSFADLGAELVEEPVSTKPQADKAKTRKKAERS